MEIYVEKWENERYGNGFFSTPHCGKIERFSQADFEDKTGKVIHRESFSFSTGVVEKNSATKTN